VTDKFRLTPLVPRLSELLGVEVLSLLSSEAAAASFLLLLFSLYLHWIALFQKFCTNSENNLTPSSKGYV
jgi:hypothetical protein